MHSALLPGVIVAFELDIINFFDVFIFLNKTPILPLQRLAGTDNKEP